MLMHELFQEQVIEERRQELEARADRVHVERAGDPRVPSFVRALIPALTHGLAGIPAPRRTAEGGC